MVEIPQLLLAAGYSERMGQPKPLLSWGNQTLIEHQIGTLLQTGQPVVVVLGAYSEDILPVIEKLPVTIVINEKWSEGMGTSISFGVNAIRENLANADGVLISLIDQPLITLQHFNAMIKKFEPDKNQIVTSKSAEGWIGVPALFDSCYFNVLRALKGEEGAKKIIQKEIQHVKGVEAGNLLADMDTPDSYQNLKRQFLRRKTE